MMKLFEAKLPLVFKALDFFILCPQIVSRASER